MLNSEIQLLEPGYYHANRISDGEEVILWVYKLPNGEKSFSCSRQMFAGLNPSNYELVGPVPNPCELESLTNCCSEVVA